MTDFRSRRAKRLEVIELSIVVASLLHGCALLGLGLLDLRRAPEILLVRPEVLIALLRLCVQVLHAVTQGLLIEAESLLR